MRVIKIPATPTEHMSVIDVPSGFPELNEALLGSKDRLIEQVYPKGLLQLSADNRPLDILMLVDEEALMVSNPVLNKRASLLYGTHVHRQPIMGDAFVVAGNRENWVDLPATVGVEEILEAIRCAIDDPRDVFA